MHGRRALVNGLLAISLLAVSGLWPAAAQGVNDTAASGDELRITLPAAMDPAERDALVEALEVSAQPMRLEDDAAATAASDAPTASVLDRVFELFGHVFDLDAVVRNWWQSLGDTPALRLRNIIGVGGAALAGGAAVWIARRLTRRWLDRLAPTGRQGFSRRLMAGFGAFGIDLLGALSFALASALVGGIVTPAAATASLSVVIGAGTSALVSIAIRNLLFAPERPAFRLIDMPDRDATAVGRWLALTIWGYAVCFGLSDLLTSPDQAMPAEALVAFLLAVVSGVIEVLVIVRIRRPIAGLIRRSYAPNGEAGRKLALIADGWFVLFVALSILTLAMRLLALLRGTAPEMASASADAMTLIIVTPFVVGAFGSIVAEFFAAEEGATPPRRAALGRALTALGVGVLLILMLALVLRVAGVDPFEPQAGPGSRAAFAVLQASAALVLGWSTWRGLKQLLDSFDVQAGTVAALQDEGAGAQGSRLHTLVPIVRSALLVTVFVTSTLMVLSALGINIAPLLAGAGVVGLAVGFGAQALVRDIISGVFFLVEDAFRKGEYIITEAGKGVVEEISLRSLRLRHHRGPLYTIPFGQIGTIQNHSRDWVKIKFFIHVPLNADLERIRKVIKRVGEELAAMPELADLFLAPLKWQGVVDIDGGAFVIGVKFVSKPGEQFLIRRLAYQRLQAAFAAAGLEFATPKVTVAGGADVSPAQAVAASRQMQVKET